MSTGDPIIDAAVHAEQTRADGPPHDRAANPQDAQIKAGQDKLLNMLSGDVKKMYEARIRAEAPAATPTAAAATNERQEIVAAIISGDLSDEQKTEASRKLRALVDNDLTPEEKQARADQTVEDRRRVYGITAPENIADSQQAEYAADWQSWETDLYDVASSNGLDAPMVRSLRDAAITLGQEVSVTGRRATDEQLTLIFNRCGVPQFARAELVKLWRQVEGT